jgi:Domain of unknown function (DUF5666)
MKINILSSALAAILGLALVGTPITAKAQTATNATSPAAPSTAPKVKEKKKGDVTQYEGSISAIDATSVTVTTKKGDLKLALDAKTQYKVDKKKSAATDFAVGDKVTGSYSTGADGSLTAHSLHKKTAK